MIYDVIIIGAGCSGVMTAYHLAPYRLKTLVLEAGEDVASGATRANSAISHAGFDAACGTLKARLNVEGTRVMPELCRKLDIEYIQNGSLVVAFGDEEAAHLKVLYERGVGNGVPDMEIIGSEKLHKLEPALSPDATHALWARSAGIVSSWGLAIAAAECAAVNGTDFLFNFRVTSVVRGEDGVFTVSDGARSCRARYVVNAAGVHAAEIAVLAGEKDFPVTILPRRGEYMLFDKTVGKTASRTLFSVPSANGKGILVSPTVHGNMIIGPNAHLIGDGDDRSTTDEGLSEILAGARRLVPSVDPRSVITSFAGVRPTPSTDDFYIRPSEQIPGLLHLCGIESPGLASSPAVGSYAVGLLRDMGLKLEEKDDFTDSRPKQVRFAELSDSEKAALIARDPLYGRIICRCETVTEGEIVDAIRRPLGARSIDMVKRRTRAGMGRCQGGFCMPRVTAILSRETGIPVEEITKCGGASRLVFPK